MTITILDFTSPSPLVIFSSSSSARHTPSTDPHLKATAALRTYPEHLGQLSDQVGAPSGQAAEQLCHGVRPRPAQRVVVAVLGGRQRNDQTVHAQQVLWRPVEGQGRSAGGGRTVSHETWQMQVHSITL